MRLPEKFFEDLYFLFGNTCACVLGPCPREDLSLASEFFCVLGLKPCVLDSTSDKNHVIKVFVSERLLNKFGYSRRETQARKTLEKEKYETCFHDAKTSLHMAEVSFLVVKTAMCKRSLTFIHDLPGA